MVMKMQICTFFNPTLIWKEQLTPLLGQEEVDRFDCQLKDLNIIGMNDVIDDKRNKNVTYTGLDHLCLHYTQLLPPPETNDHYQLCRLITSIGSWPLV